MFILGCNSDLDFEVAKVVFKIDSDSYRWGIPFFSVDRNAAAMVNTEMAFREDESRERYNKEIERIATERGWKSTPECLGVPMLLCLLLPEEICKAAIIACLENKDGAIPSGIDKGHSLFHEITQDDFSEYRNKKT
jgi:hypothetical protein